MIRAIDTETTLATDFEPVPRLVSVALYDEVGGGSLYAAHDPRLPRLLEESFAEHTCAFANIPFDAHVFFRALPQLRIPIIRAYMRGGMIDVLTREKMIDIADGAHFRRGKYGLGPVAERRAGVMLDKNDPWRRRYGELMGFEISAWPAEAKRYALLDPFATWAAAVAQEREADKLIDQARQARAHLALYAQTLSGMLTDQKMVERVDQLLFEQWKRHTTNLVTNGLARVGGTKASPKIVRNEKKARALIEDWGSRQGITIKRSKKTEKPSLSKEALEDLNLPIDHPLFSYQAFGSVQSMREKNIEPMRWPIVRTRYDECIATNRTSSSAPGDPWHGTNLQNLPRSIARQLGFATHEDMLAVHGPTGFRECLVPPEGHKLIAPDWGMMELVCLAQTQFDWFGRSTLGSALRDGRDPHEELGSSIAGFNIAGHPERKTWRTLAKAPNFGYPGGLGAARFCDFARSTYGIDITEQRARRLKAIWRRQWPEMAAYHKRIDSLQASGGWIDITLDRTGFRRGRCRYTEACNFPFQGLAAACAKDALWAIWLACQPEGPLYGSWQTLFVHDENVLCVPKEKVSDTVPVVEQIMVRAVERLCPDVPVSVETPVLDRYTK